MVNAWHKAKGESMAGFDTHVWSKAASSGKVAAPAQKYWTASSFKLAPQSAQLLAAVRSIV